MSEIPYAEKDYVSGNLIIHGKGKSWEFDGVNMKERPVPEKGLAEKLLHIAKQNHTSSLTYDLSERDTPEKMAQCALEHFLEVVDKHNYRDWIKVELKEAMRKSIGGGA